jgi:cell division protein FtsB
MNIDSSTALIFLIVLPLFVLITLYRMWIIAKIYRIKYYYSKPGHYVGKDFSKQELEKEQVKLEQENDSLEELIKKFESDSVSTVATSRLTNNYSSPT